MRLKSRPGRKTNAENESFAFLGVRAVRAVHFDRAGDYYQTYRSGAGPVCGVLLWVFCGGDVRLELADVPGARLKKTLWPRMHANERESITAGGFRLSRFLPV